MLMTLPAIHFDFQPATGFTGTNAMVGGFGHGGL
jgi:hypothetical protein